MLASNRRTLQPHALPPAIGQPTGILCLLTNLVAGHASASAAERALNFAYPARFPPRLQLSACEGVLPRISSIHPLVLLASSAANSSSNPSSSSSHGEHPGNAGPAAAEPAAAGQQAAGGERILVRGSALLGEQCRLLVRSGGAYPLVEILASSGPLGVPRRAAGTAGTAGTAGVFAREDEWLEIRCGGFMCSSTMVNLPLCEHAQGSTPVMDCALC